MVMLWLHSASALQERGGLQPCCYPVVLHRGYQEKSEASPSHRTVIDRLQQWLQIVCNTGMCFQREA